MEDLLKALVDIQQRLDVPKNQVNNFGHYNYRSLEDIEAAIKPLLREHACGIRFSDQVVEHCGRTFLQTTLIFFNTKGDEISVTAEAEHASTKAGMDNSQITGAASSYARKYAMNALFAIDDTKDADTDQYNQASSSRANATTRTRTRAKSSASQPRDKFAGIKAAINATNDTQSLLLLYRQHETEINGNQDIKAMFTQRKQEILSTPINVA
jgi:hypothetical protein